MHRQMLMIWLMVSACLLLACSRYEVIPDDLRGEVDRTVTFEQVKESPSSYKGRLSWSAARSCRSSVWKTEPRGGA